MADALRGLGLASLFKNSSTTLGRQLAAGLLQLGTVIVIARVYGAKANGAYAVALLLPTMLSTFLNFGVGPANVFFLGSKQYHPRAVFRTSLQLNVAFSIVGMSAGAALIALKGEKLFPGVPTLMLWLALLTFPLSLAQTFVSSVFQGLQKFREFNISLLAQPLITFLIVLCLSLAGLHNFGWLLIAYTVGVASTLVITCLFLRSMVQVEGAIEAYGWRKALSYGYRAHLSNILAFANYKIDIFLVNLLVNPAAAGVYVVAVQMSERLWLLSQAVSTVALPRLSQMEEEESARRVITPLLARFVLASTALAALVVSAVAMPLIILLFGPEFRGAAWVLIVLMPGIVAGSGARILANDIAARGKPELNMHMSMLTLLINVVGNLLLIPAFGMRGAALATTIAYVVNLSLRIYMYRRQTGIAPARVLFVCRGDLHSILGHIRKA
jgi:O-antigen/teichoic acid export membrane protein